MQNTVVNNKPFRILQNPRRMMIIKVLRELGGTVCLREVVRRIATTETGGNPDRNHRKSVYNSIVQNHLPKMEQAGLIEYNRHNDALHLLDLPETYQYHLEAVEKGDLPWCLYYLTLSTVGLASSIAFFLYTGLIGASSLTFILSLLLLTAALFHTTRTYNIAGNELLPLGIRAITKRLSAHKEQH